MPRKKKIVLQKRGNGGNKNKADQKPAPEVTKVPEKSIDKDIQEISSEVEYNPADDPEKTIISSNAEYLTEKITLESLSNTYFPEQILLTSPAPEGSLLRSTTPCNQIIFSVNDVPLPASMQTVPSSFYKTNLKKTPPFKSIYTEFIIPLLVKSDSFYSENAFCMVFDGKKLQKKTHLIRTDIPRNRKNVQNSDGNVFNFKKDGKILKCLSFPLNASFKTSYSYLDTLINHHKTTIFLTDQVHHNLDDQNYVFSFSVRTVMNRVIKFTDLRIIALNLDDSVKLYAYGIEKETNPVEIYENEDVKIVIQCNSFFTKRGEQSVNLSETDQNEIQSFYSTPVTPSNVSLHLSLNKVISKPAKLQRKDFLSFLSSIDLDDGDYILRDMKIHRMGKEGDIFSTDGFVHDG